MAVLDGDAAIRQVFPDRDVEVGCDLPIKTEHALVLRRRDRPRDVAAAVFSGAGVWREASDFPVRAAAARV
ncbi:hypothetical protein [Bradyrhizobium commune]|uniref:Uncharacterized protein n=1 Tax=Bradyrhizobium commune TaxID=83627 RepID=A0A7S9DA33_9BRAD|nr:hypothetical protein [Bradyrhizobium commune]QPF93783.1 hypothetical protein IC761_11180 [Bradyrhizobium commune]